MASKIHSTEDTRILLYKNLKFTPPEHTAQNIFIAEGPKVVSKLFSSDIKIVSFFSTFEYFQIYEKELIRKKVSPENIYIAEKSLIDEVVGFNLHYGILAIGEKPNKSDLSDLDDKIVVFNGIVNSENIGSIIRNACAFGVNSIIYDSSSSDPYLRRAVRVSMGSVFLCKIYQSKNLIDSINQLKRNGYTIIGAEICESSIPLGEIAFPQKVAIIFGAEGPGITKEILENCDFLTYIPIEKAVDSINVSAASAIILNRVWSGKRLSQKQ